MHIISGITKNYLYYSIENLKEKLKSDMYSLSIDLFSSPNNNFENTTKYLTSWYLYKYLFKLIGMVHFLYSVN